MFIHKSFCSSTLLIILIVFGINCLDTNSTSNDYNVDSDYDYNANETDINDTGEEECSAETFFDRIRAQHEFGSAVSHKNETTDEILVNLRNITDKLLGLTADDKYRLIEYLSEADIGLSSECSAAYYKVYQSFKDRHYWAIKMIDSIGAFPPKGFFEGVFADFGEYDECLSVESPATRDGLPPIRGKHCIAKIILPFPSIDLYTYQESGKDLNDLIGFKYKEFTLLGKTTEKNMVEGLNMINGSIFQLGICVPSVCTPQEIQTMLNKVFYPILKLPIEVDSTCKTKEDPISLDIYQKVCCSILLVLAIGVFIGTGYELMNLSDENSNERTPSKTSQYMKCFSVISNTRSLFETTSKFATLDTIRLLLILNVHILHAYLLTYTMGLKTLKKVFVWVVPRIFNDWRYFIVKSPLMIDALFTLSGFLISYSLMRRLHHTKGRFNYISYLFQQWLRFVIIVLGSVTFYFVFPLLFSGPVWHTADEYMTNGCRNPMNLIKILFFINNFQEFQIEKFHLSCNITLWFMSSLYQFLIISPIFIILYYKKPRIGTYVMAVALCVTLVTTISPFLLFGIRPYVQRLSGGSSFLTSRLNDSMNWFHTTPNNHAFSYFMGIAFGFLMTKERIITANKVRFFWLLSIMGISLSYYWNNSFWYTGSEEKQTSALLWHTVGKVIYCMSFGWIYYACCTRRGGIFDRVLSWHGFQPITRLSFGVYLLHYMIVIRRIFIVKQTNYINDRVMMRNLTMDLMFDILMAYIFYLLIESPFSNLFRIFFGRRVIQKTK